MKNRNVTELGIGVLAIVSVVLVAVESLVTVSREMLFGIYIADSLICVVFAWDFIHRLRASGSKSRFMKTNGFEILAMIPAIALYALGAIPVMSTAFRSLRLIRVIRVILLMARMRRVVTKLGRFLRRSNLLAMSGIIAGIIFIGAFAVLALEGGDRKCSNHQLLRCSLVVYLNCHYGWLW